jgi:hypothetical protein
MDLTKYGSEVRDLLGELGDGDANEEQVLKDIRSATTQALLRLKTYDRKDKARKDK